MMYQEEGINNSQKGWEMAVCKKLVQENAEMAYFISQLAPAVANVVTELTCNSGHFNGTWSHYYSTT